MSISKLIAAGILLGVPAGTCWAQDAPIADPGSLAFEQGRWQDVIDEYRKILEKSPTDRLSWLRIAQAERELGRYEEALASLEQARAVEAPPAMVDLERTRDLLALGRREEAMSALFDADHNELRALDLLEESPDFDSIRNTRRFQEIIANVRARVYPCESIKPASDFDFWVGRWEVRGADGTLLGYNTITKEEGGCAIREHWEGTGGSTGTSLSFYLPSREQWRQVWVGANGTMFDVTGGLEDGEMKLEGTIEYTRQENVLAFRGTWSQGPDGRVRQRMEQFDLVSQGWDLWFDGFYRRIGGP